MEDGRKYPIFSSHGVKEIHCNICDIVILKSIEEVTIHTKSCGHQCRLSDKKRATQTLLGKIEIHLNIFFVCYKHFYHSCLKNMKKKVA